MDSMTFGNLTLPVIGQIYWPLLTSASMSRNKFARNQLEKHGWTEGIDHADKGVCIQMIGFIYSKKGCLSFKSSLVWS